MSTAVDVWSGVVGQGPVVAELRAAAQNPVHAYLFVGKPGSGTRSAALAFAADVLSRSSSGDPDRAARLALAGEHPDLVVIEREGASISSAQAREAVRLASRPPGEGERKVIVLTDFHLVEQRAPILLKSIEEPPESTVFVVLADEITPDLVTIASRCVQFRFAPLPEDSIAGALAGEGVDEDRARAAAIAAAGDLDRARLLAADPELDERQRAWRTVPDRLDGTGATAARVTDELLDLLDRAGEPVKEAHRAELAEIEARAEQTGERVPMRSIEERHRRELRRARTDELRSGLLTLARRYRDGLADAPDPRPDAQRILELEEAMEELVRNPNERLLLQAMLLTLGRR